MKKAIQILALAACTIAATCFTVTAQSGEAFVIKSPFKRSTYQGVELRSMKNKELKAILSNDAAALKKYKSGNAVSGTGTALLCVGTFLVLLNSLQSVNSVQSGSVETDNTLSNVGLGVLVASIPCFIAGGAMRKNAIRQFHNPPKTTAFLSPLFSPSQKFAGLRVSIRF